MPAPLPGDARFRRRHWEDARVSNAIIDDLRWRDLIAHSTDLDALQGALDAGPITLYCGFDPTAASLHLGNLVQILTVRRFQQAGHRPLLLVGGSTGLIGDPKMSGERTLNAVDVVHEWVDRIRGQLEPFFDFTGPQAARTGSASRISSRAMTDTSPPPVSAQPRSSPASTRTASASRPAPPRPSPRS